MMPARLSWALSLHATRPQGTLEYWPSNGSGGPRSDFEKQVPLGNSILWGYEFFA